MAGEPAKAATEERAPTRKLRWVFGWVVVPLAVVSTLFLSGVHVGARHPDKWMSRAVLWMFNAEAQLGPEGPMKALGPRLRLAVLPSTGHSLRVELSEAELAELVEQGLGSSAANLDCARVCRQLWEVDHPDRTFIEATQCSLTPAKDESQAVLDCEARVQRARPAP